MSVDEIGTDLTAFAALFGADRRPDPYPHYRLWRERAPIIALSPQTYVASGFAEVAQALRDPAFGHSEPEVLDPAERTPDRPVDASGRVVRSFLGLNPPDHTRLRRLVSKAFTPRMVEQLTPRIEQITADLLDRLPAEGPADLMTALAKPLPVEVIAELLGVPLDDRERFAVWSSAMARGWIRRSCRARRRSNRRTTPGGDSSDTSASSRTSGDGSRVPTCCPRSSRSPTPGTRSARTSCWSR